MQKGKNWNIKLENGEPLKLRITDSKIQTSKII